MPDSRKSLSRREALGGLIVLPTLAGLMISSGAVADAKSSKAAVKYQSHPSGGKKCSGCRFFQPGKTASAMGTCSIVDGAISPNGWCTAFTAK